MCRQKLEWKCRIARLIADRWSFTEDFLEDQRDLWLSGGHGEQAHLELVGVEGDGLREGGEQVVRRPEDHKEKLCLSSHEGSGTHKVEAVPYRMRCVRLSTNSHTTFGPLASGPRLVTRSSSNSSTADMAAIAMRFVGDRKAEATSNHPRRGNAAKSTERQSCCALTAGVGKLGPIRAGFVLGLVGRDAHSALVVDDHHPRQLSKRKLLKLYQRGRRAVDMLQRRRASHCQLTAAAGSLKPEQQHWQHEHEPATRGWSSQACSRQARRPTPCGARAGPPGAAPPT